MIVSLQNVPKNLPNVRNIEKRKLRISTKPFYKLFSVVHNYIQLMCLSLKRYMMIVSLQNVPKNSKHCEKGKPENVNIYWSMLQTFQCGSQLISMNVSNHEI